MSNKSKNKGVIPAAASGKKLYSLSDLGPALGFKPSDRPTPKSMKCRKCGTVMRNIPNTNVWVCDGMVEQEKDGVKKQVACGNRAITGGGSRPQNPDNPGNSKSGKPKNHGNSAKANAENA
jgi:hypothetical protein